MVEVKVGWPRVDSRHVGLAPKATVTLAILRLRGGPNCDITPCDCLMKLRRRALGGAPVSLKIRPMSLIRLGKWEPLMMLRDAIFAISVVAALSTPEQLQAQQVWRVGTNEIGSPWSFHDAASHSERGIAALTSLPRSAKTPDIPSNLWMPTIWA